MVAKLVLCALGVAHAFTAPLSVRSNSVVASISMDEAKTAPKKEKPPPKPRLPGEGDPFGEVAQAFSDANKDGGSAYQPRGISDATVVDAYQSYIEADDEPWHSTCRPVAVVDMAGLEAAKPAAIKEKEAEEEASGKKKIGGGTPGWKNQGEGRVIGKTHDNSV